MNTFADQFRRVGVLMGGVSSEREISLKSGKAIIEAFDRQGFDVLPLDIVSGNRDKIACTLLGQN